MVQLRRSKLLSRHRWRLALLLLLSLGILLLAACAGDNNTEQAQPTKQPDYVVNVGKSLYLSADGAGGQNLQSTSVLSIIVEWKIVKPVIDPNSPPPAVIINPNSTTPTFVAYVAGEYVLHMTITWADSNEILAEREITIKVGLEDVQTAKPANHIASSDMCFDCHNADNWLLPVVDHTQVIGTCSSCHDGVVATGKGPTHIATSLECDSCHATSAWLSSSSFPSNHMNFTANCINCHDGVAASGKPATHMNTSSACEACHNTSYWRPVSIIDHNQVIGTCESCHNGVSARGKSANHVVTVDACDLCHTTVSWLDVASNCTNVNPCPTPTDPNSGGTGSGGTGSGNGSGSGSGSNTTPGNVPDHSTLIGNCITCHNGVDASGKSAAHIASSDLCDACHVKFPATWAPVAASSVDHSQVIGTCSSCHNGVNAKGMSPTHIITSQECDACHVVNYWIPPPPAI